MTDCWEEDEEKIRRAFHGRLEAALTSPAAPAPIPGEGAIDALPRPLVAAIREGTCVAFVGAGFSVAAKVPLWGDLLRKVAACGELDDAARRHVLKLVDKGHAHALDEAAQFLQDVLERERFVVQVRQAMVPQRTEQMDRRLWHLLRIPFRAILTTNFDQLPPGIQADAQAFRRVLRRPKRSAWDAGYWGAPIPVHVVKLHGELKMDKEGEPPIVLTREDYRKRLYDRTNYSTFLKSVLATNTVLYLGFSFSDAYLTELRSEVLATIGAPPPGFPYGYAVLPDTAPETRKHFLKHEGLEILGYRIEEEDDPPHLGLDRYLERLYRETNPLPRFASYLEHQRILWVDPHYQENNDGERDFIRRAARAAGVEAPLCEVRSVEEALTCLRAERTRPFTLILTHWGEEEGTAKRLLTALREVPDRPPVAVYSWRDDVDQRRRAALSLGATAYCYEPDGLFREIERIFEGAGE